MRAALLSSQRQEFHVCEHRVRDPVGDRDITGGGVSTTSIGAMTLEVDFRVRRAHAGVEFRVRTRLRFGCSSRPEVLRHRNHAVRSRL